MSKNSVRLFPSIPKHVEDLLLRACKPFVLALKTIENAKIEFDAGEITLDQYHNTIDETFVELHKSIEV